MNSCARPRKSKASGSILEATHTHLYPGNRGKISGISQIAGLKRGLDCLVAFSDGSAASAVLSRTESGWQLYTSAYRTVAGTDIAEKLWFVRLHEDGGEVKFHILSKAKRNQ